MASQQVRWNTTETVIPRPCIELFLFYNGYLNNINVVACCNCGPGTKPHLTITSKATLKLLLLQRGETYRNVVRSQ